MPSSITFENKQEGVTYELKSGEVVLFYVREDDDIYEYEGEFLGCEDYGILFKLTDRTVQGWPGVDAHMMLVDLADFAGLRVKQSNLIQE